MKDGWTDERLDDFAKHVDQRFDAVDRRFDAVDRQVREGFDRVDGDIRELRTDMNARFEKLHHTTLLTNGAIIAALIGVIATQI